MLENINAPSDVKKLSVAELKVLAEDIRKGIINRVNTIGGHLGPDLGVVEATIAMHYVFNSLEDKFVFDISHQCYPHKMLTGRKQGFTNPLEYPEISGYSNPAESEHDHFVIGHTSTSVSLASGLAKARDLKGEKSNIVALIGDGSLSGGEAFEGFNNAAVLDSNMIIIVNDNEMSIAENQGGLYKNLAELRNSNGTSKNNIFTALGFEYFYVEEGNNIEKLIETFKQVKDTTVPVVIHIHTIKGKGYEPAETNKEAFHWTTPGFLEPSKPVFCPETYSSVTTDYFLKKHAEDKNLVVISPATPGATGFTKEFREKMGENYTDVGIAEEHAVAYASGLARNGAKPVLTVLSSFIQRAYDQLSQDLALNNSPATILVCWGGISAADMTHLQTFDIPLISNIPNIVYLAPTCKEEYLAMLDWSIDQTEYPVAIRVPNIDLVSTGKKDLTDYSILNKYEIAEKGDTVAILGLGNFFELGYTVKKEL
ncbi:1-deoxy-D-xylulose-5-phosphate synthase, partial [bacterium]|nr:1-deoxy-D-xylulose-5-phosphate synthase [bacterium]